VSRAIRSALDEFARAIDTAAPELLTDLAPGLNPSGIATGLAPLTSEPPDELVALYQWQNGYAPDVGSWRDLFLGWRPVSLDRAVYWRLRFNEIRDENARRYGTNMDVDRSGWLGIFEQPGYIVLNADLNSVGPGGEVPIYRSYVKDLETRLVASSLAEVLDAWTALLGAGAAWDEGRWSVPRSADDSLLRASGH
jgi:hypothetical protein